MKRLIFILLVSCLVLTGYSQDVERTGSVGTSLGWYTGNASDSITDNQDTVYVEFRFGPDKPWESDINVHLDTLEAFTANDSIKVEPFGKVFESDSYVSIGSAKYYDALSDSPLTFQEHSTADYIRYVRISIIHIGSAGKATLNGANKISGKHDIEIKGWDMNNSR